MPGSRIILSSLMPASKAACVRSRRKSRTCCFTSPPIEAGMVFGMPFMCMMTAWMPVEAHSSTIPSSLRP